MNKTSESRKNQKVVSLRSQSGDEVGSL